VILSAFPRRTVFADVYRRDGVHVGYDAIEDNFGVYSIREIADIGATRHITRVLETDLDRETAEAHCLALIEDHTHVRSAA
jgi:hypothetical protein